MDVLLSTSAFKFNFASLHEGVQPLQRRQVLQSPAPGRPALDKVRETS
jgi:hypothetical protein